MEASIGSMDTSVADAEFIHSFEDCSMEEDRFHHADHIRLAWLYLNRYAMIEALQRFSSGLRQFAESKGAPTLYHETITWGYLFLISERMTESEDWSLFADRNHDLFRWHPSILDDYYHSETLYSDRARSSFVMPDRRIRSGIDDSPS